MTWKLPHDKDFATNADLTRYLNENAQAIEQAINDIQKELGTITQRQARLDKELTQQRQRIDELEHKHDELAKSVDHRLKKIEQILFGAELINRTDDDEPSEVQPDSYLVNDTDTVNDDNGIIESNLIN